MSNPVLADWFAGYNRTRLRNDWVRPGSFGLIAHPASVEHGDPAGAKTAALPAAPYEDDPGKWPRLNGYDRHNGEPIRITTAERRSDPDAFADALARGDAIVQSLSQVLGRYTRRPEHKSLAPDGRPAGPDTYGLLARRAIRSEPATTQLTGKEGTSSPSASVAKRKT